MTNENTQIENSYTDQMELNFENCWLAKEDYLFTPQEYADSIAVQGHTVHLPCDCAVNIVKYVRHSFLPLMISAEHFVSTVDSFRARKDFGLTAATDFAVCIITLDRISPNLEYVWNPHDIFRPMEERTDGLLNSKELVLEHYRKY